VNINDRVDQISATIEQLRQQDAGGRGSRELVDSLFRTVHSFKAAAAAENLTNLSHTAHEFEDLLQALRNGKMTLDAEVFGVFDETIAALRNGSKAAALTRLNETTRRTTSGGGELPAEFASLKENERHRAVAALREGANLYLMNVDFDASDFDERFRQLKARLEAVAELISASVTMEDDKVVFQIIYASSSEKIPVQTVFQQAALAGKSVAAKLNKEVEFVLKADEVLLDRPSSDVLTDALLHLVRNAVDHGIESQGRVTLATQTSEGKLRIFVTDNGRGVDPANLPLLFQPGFSTATEVSEMSGRGVGLDAVKIAVETIGGTINVISVPQEFTSFVITMPNPSWDA
jgi:two-component system, chemotaxis family, sensor kinase CheA